MATWRSARRARPVRGGRRLLAWARAAALGAMVLGGAGAAAVPIAPSAISKLASEESFEGLAPGGEVGTQPGLAGVLLPGATGPYTFASGVTLFGPNTYVFPNDAFVHDLGVAGAVANDWGANGSVGAATDVPFGTAYLGVFESGAALATVEFVFASPVNTVGAFVAGDAGSDVTLEAYASDGSLLEAITVAAPSVAAWGDGFVGLFRAEGIASVIFRGHDFGIDGLYFEGTTLVPEPGTALQVSLGLVMLSLVRRRRGRDARAASGGLS